MNALHFLSKNFALIAGKKGRLFRKGWRDNENKKSEKLFRFHYEHSTPILSDCLYMFCGIMQRCCNMFLVLLCEMGLVSGLTGGGVRFAGAPLQHSLEDQGKAQIGRRRNALAEKARWKKGDLACVVKSHSDRGPLCQYLRCPDAWAERRAGHFHNVNAEELSVHVSLPDLSAGAQCTWRFLGVRITNSICCHFTAYSITLTCSL